MKTLTLDYSKWRCGGDSKTTNKHGSGNTALLNKAGYMCCLGQWSLQLGAKKEQLLGMGSPEDIDERIPGLSIKKKGRVFTENTKLSCEAMKINDNKETTANQKIRALRKLLSKHGYRLKVINQPKTK